MAGSAAERVRRLEEVRTHYQSVSRDGLGREPLEGPLLHWLREERSAHRVGEMYAFLHGKAGAVGALAREVARRAPREVLRPPFFRSLLDSPTAGRAGDNWEALSRNPHLGIPEAEQWQAALQEQWRKGWRTLSVETVPGVLRAVRCLGERFGERFWGPEFWHWMLDHLDSLEDVPYDRTKRFLAACELARERRLEVPLLERLSSHLAGFGEERERIPRYLALREGARGGEVPFHALRARFLLLREMDGESAVLFLQEVPDVPFALRRLDLAPLLALPAGGDRLRTIRLVGSTLERCLDA